MYSSTAIMYSISSIPLPPLPLPLPLSLPCSGHSVKGEVPLPGPVACGANQTVIYQVFTHTQSLQYNVQVHVGIYMYIHVYMYIVYAYTP